MIRLLVLGTVLAEPVTGGAFAAGGPAPQPEVVPAPAPAAADSDRDRAELERSLQAIDARAATIRTLRGTFTQRKHTPVLKKPMVSSGTFAIKGSRTRWETLEPRRSVITIDDRGLRLYYPDQKLVEIYEVGEDIRELAASPLPRLGKLRVHFDIERDRTIERPARQGAADLLGLELASRTDEMKRHIARIRVLIDTAVPVVRWMEIEDVDGERTEIELNNVEADAEVADAEVVFQAAPGTREVRPIRGGAGEPNSPRDGGG